MTVVSAWWPLASQRSAHAVSGHPGPLGDEVRVAPQGQRDVRVAEERHHQKTSPGVLPSAARFYASKTAHRRKSSPPLAQLLHATHGVDVASQCCQFTLRVPRADDVTYPVGWEARLPVFAFWLRDRFAAQPGRSSQLIAEGGKRGPLFPWSTVRWSPLSTRARYHEHVFGSDSKQINGVTCSGPYRAEAAGLLRPPGDC